MLYSTVGDEFPSTVGVPVVHVAVPTDRIRQAQGVLPAGCGDSGIHGLRDSRDRSCGG